MKIKKEALSQELNQMLDKALVALHNYQSQSLEALNFKPSTEEWSILECIEHLNRYGRFYVPEIRQRMEKSNHQRDDIFNSGFLGNYFAESLRSKPQLNKMKTFKSMNPAGSNLGVEVILEQEQQIKELQNIITQFEKINLTKIKTSITISSWIKLRLGDTLRVVIYHIDRHIDQANRLI